MQHAADAGAPLQAVVLALVTLKQTVLGVCTSCTSARPTASSDLGVAPDASAQPGPTATADDDERVVGGVLCG